MTQSQALAILKTGKNVFLTGEPGSGKTYAINEYVAYLRSRGIEPAITASTGIAATHIGGMTIHSWSGIGIKTELSKHDLHKIASSQYIAKRVRHAKVLIIEEVSMLTPETLSMVDRVCRQIKQNLEPFGGIQVVLAGDFFQLPPVVKRENQDNAQTKLMKESSPRFAYGASAWKELNPFVCYLTGQYRQDDADFLALLSAIRRNAFSIDHVHHIEARKTRPQAVPENAPKLFTHNADVDRINDEILAKLPDEPHGFPMSAHGPDALVAALKKGCLSPETLFLKVGAAVMFTKNNPKEGFVNGTLGVIEGFNKTSGYPIIKARNGRQITVEPMDWTVEESGTIRAQIRQMPLRLAWAITIHKSQGMTLDQAVMDLSGVFEFGQGYVALSRVRRLSDLFILGWNEHAFQVHPDVVVKDGEFCAQSASTVDTFTKMGRDNIAAMHKQFIGLCAGNVVSDGRTKLRPSGFEKIRETYPQAYFPWDTKQDEKLKSLFAKGLSIENLSKIFGRKNGAIKSRLVRLGLTELPLGKASIKWTV